jgi:hypothetical protein
MYNLFVLSLLSVAVVGQMTQTFRNNILRDHNDKRRTATNAANMIELRYDMALEQVAQAYLQRGCAGGFQHNPNRGCQYTSFGGTNGGTGTCASVGENWYSGAPDNQTGTDVAIGGAVAQWTDGTCSSWVSPPLRCGSRWCSEKQNFYQTGSDSYGLCTQNSGQTLHWTQAMWPTTTHVGCGYTVACGTLCNYAPAGNMNLPPMGSMRETNVWRIGTPCSACPSGYTRCNAGLCSAASGSTSCPADTVNKPTNGNVGSCGSSVAVGSSCTQTCNSGYTLTSGSLSRQCQSSGSLAAVTAVCSAVTCPADTTTKPSNGNAGTCGTSKSYGQTCSMACNTGFSLTSGSLVRTCGSNGQYSAASAVCSAPVSPVTEAPQPPATQPPVTTQAATLKRYCTSGPTSDQDTEFGDVRIVGYGSLIYDTSSCPGTIGPQDLTNLHATLLVGQTYEISFAHSTCGDYYTALAGAWIDWDQDYNWDDSERIFAFTQQYGAVTYAFTVPASARLGTTRLRLQIQETAEPTINPCAMFDWGDTKDYTVVVVAAASSAALSAPSAVAVAELVPATCNGDRSAPLNGGPGTCALSTPAGHTCMQTCNPGFSRREGSLERTCDPTGNYTPITAICGADVICAPDSVVPVNGGQGTCAENGTLGSTCTQTCNRGFRPRAGTSLLRECTRTGYSASTAICE